MTATDQSAKIAEPMTMKTLTLTVRFLTPAFLGDANQNACWRTPPFKHLLREWWRVAYAAAKGFNINLGAMRREEGLLFGNAWLSHQVNGRDVNVYTKSLIRTRLKSWEFGNLDQKEWRKGFAPDHPELGKGWRVIHPDVGEHVGPLLYTGYGPLEVEKVSLPRGADYATRLKQNAAIQAEETATLALGWPDNFPEALRETIRKSGAPEIWPEHITERLLRALWLADRYGTLGGRSRNGWGSFALAPLPPGEGLGVRALPLRPWRDCLNLDWPHAIGADNQGNPLIWQTQKEYDDWKTLMRDLAIVKIGLRTQFRFTTEKNARHTDYRHWLSYPITNHSVMGWGENLRLPNSLRFKVRQTENGKLVGVIFHMPHLPPPAFDPNKNAIIETWQCVHEFLDALTNPAAKRRYCAKADTEALAKQKHQLDSVMLKRIQD